MTVPGLIAVGALAYVLMQEARRPEDQPLPPTRKASEFMAPLGSEPSTDTLYTSVEDALREKAGLQNALYKVAPEPGMDGQRKVSLAPLDSDVRLEKMAFFPKDRLSSNE